MIRPTPVQRAKAATLLDREMVAGLISSYATGCAVVWSAGRVLYRLGITGHTRQPPGLKRRARRLLEELAAAGLLMHKPGVLAQSADGSKEVGYVRAPAALDGEPDPRVP